MSMVSRAGLAISVSAGSGDALPPRGTVFNRIWVFAQGYQELDLDVERSCELVHNYEARASGTGSVANPTERTLPPSMAHASQPNWWDEDGFGLKWPPIEASSPNLDAATLIPAGRRFFSPPRLRNLRILR